MAKNLTRWNKFGRFISGIVIGCFFLPFFGISCDGMDVVTFSGTDMVGGCKPGGVLTQMDDDQKNHPEKKTGSVDIKIENTPREPLAIAAFAVVLVCFGLAWVRTRKALLASCALSIVGLALLIALYVKVKGDLGRDIDEQASKGSKMLKKGEVSAGGRMGLWGACLGLIAISTLTGLALKEKDAPDPQPPAA
ncbi:MAG: hypothetical protein JWO36_3917 [Myxococcales bacterium]|nr:hypothetical protein [Myxococcales bacterium]